MMAVGQHNGEF